MYKEFGAPCFWTRRQQVEHEAYTRDRASGRAGAGHHLGRPARPEARVPPLFGNIAASMIYGACLLVCIVAFVSFIPAVPGWFATRDMLKRGYV